MARTPVGAELNGHDRAHVPRVEPQRRQRQPKRESGKQTGRGRCVRG